MGYQKPGKLNDLRINSLSERGYFSDGGGLYLRITEGGTKCWAFRYVRNGKLREVGLGAKFDIGLSEAREKAAGLRKQLREGTDPLAEKKAAIAARTLAEAKRVTFDWCGERYIAQFRSSWKNEKHASQWENTLKTYASPVIGSLAVDAVDTGLVLKILQPIWSSKPETASRVRGRIESVLDWAKISGHREGDNPARWQGHLEFKLPKRTAAEHHPALPFVEINAFVSGLRGQEGIAARALEFLILCAARAGEVVNAEWKEFDLNNAVWVVPARRMKLKKEHRVPLPPRAVEILKGLLAENGGEYPFHGGKPGKPLSTAAMLALLRRMGRDDITTHGMRSAFRDWAAEKTNYQNHVIEMALAHAIGDKVEAAYRRGELFDKRRALMQAWQDYIDTPQSKPVDNVIELNRGGAA